MKFRCLNFRLIQSESVLNIVYRITSILGACPRFDLTTRKMDLDFTALSVIEGCIVDIRYLVVVIFLRGFPDLPFQEYDIDSCIFVKKAEYLLNL